ncbi:hypothetical protein OSTOST_00594 [Ostertagia ostertagi]
MFSTEVLTDQITATLLVIAETDDKSLLGRIHNGDLQQAKSSSTNVLLYTINAKIELKRIPQCVIEEAISVEMYVTTPDIYREFSMLNLRRAKSSTTEKRCCSATGRIAPFRSGTARIDRVAMLVSESSPKMPASYSSTPISGFTGHIPGAKWQVGSRYRPPTRALQSSYAPSSFSDQSSVQFSPEQSRRGYNERNQGGSEPPYPEDSQLSLLRPGSSEMSIIYNSEGFPVRIIKNNQVLHTSTSDAHSIRGLNSPGSEHLRNGFPLENSPQPQTRPPSVKQRARSLPRRPVERDPFEGLEGGWWSKGEVLRNKERRELANTGKTVAGGDWSQRPETPKQQRQSRWKEEDDDNIPAAGYSGHMPGLRQLGIGKSFNAAAREAKRDYSLRRRANSGGRAETSGTSVSRNSDAQNDSYNDGSRSRKQTEYTYHRMNE